MTLKMDTVRGAVDWIEYISKSYGHKWTCITFGDITRAQATRGGIAELNRMIERLELDVEFLRKVESTYDGDTEALSAIWRSRRNLQHYAAERITAIKYFLLQQGDLQDLWENRAASER